MRQFCYRCRSCGFRFEAPATMGAFHISCCSFMDIIRDYKAESVGTAISHLKREREARIQNPRELLATSDDFKSKDDPDGQKGLRKYLDEMVPKNKHAERAKGRIEKELGLTKQVF